MSHFTKIKTQVKDLKVLKQCLDVMGYTWREGRQKLRGFSGQATEADLVAIMPEGYNIGFIRDPSGCYDIVADWWGVKGVTQAEFARTVEGHFAQVQNAIRRQYAHGKVTSELKNLGFTVVDQKRDEDGTIRIHARRFS